MSTFNNIFPVCVQLTLSPSLANIGNTKNGNFTWSAPFTYSISSTYIGNDLITTNSYGINDIQKGFWIGTSGGLAWRIYDKIANLDGTCTFYLEDVDNYCINLDNTGARGVPNNGGEFIAFEVNEEGQPL